MNIRTAFSSSGIRSSLCVLALLSALPMAALAAGSGGVNMMITHTEDAGANVSYTGYGGGATYQWATGNNVVFDGFVFNGKTYLASQVAVPDRLVIRRSNNAFSTGVRCRIFGEESAVRVLVSTFPGTPPPSGTTSGTCSMESVLGERILNRGSLDLFGNSDNDSPGRSKNNIERVDYITTAGLTLPNIPGFPQDQGILVNEKSHNNPLQVAVITALDANGDPLNFGPLLCVRPGRDGSSGTGDVPECRPGSQNWVRYGPHVRYIENGTNIGQRAYPFRFLEDEQDPPQTGRAQSVGRSNEHLGAAFVSLEDLGVSAGATIYGYAWFPVDVVNCPGFPNNTCLADWTNTTIYPANTGDAPSTGNGWDAGADIFGGLVGLFPSPLDFGDAPDGYLTTLANGGPRHIIDTDLTIGSVVDSEDDGQPTLGAVGDDTNGRPDDEDGVTFSAPVGGGTNIVAAVSVTNTTGGSATLCGWLDLDVNGTFDLGEGQCSTPVAPSTSFTWVLSGTGAQNYFSRFRLCSIASECDDPTGLAANGEVEDYVVTYSPTSVTIGQVALGAVQVEDFLAGLDVDRMDAAALLELLGVWDPEAALRLTDAYREALLPALEQYLDPDDDGQVAVLQWETTAERGTVGFYVERNGDQGAGVWHRINDDMMPGLIAAPLGASYMLVDPEARSGVDYSYRLIEQEARGTRNTYGPFPLTLQ